jgi:hypothetical protein
MRSPPDVREAEETSAGRDLLAVKREKKEVPRPSEPPVRRSALFLGTGREQPAVPSVLSQSASPLARLSAPL